MSEQRYSSAMRYIYFYLYRFFLRTPSKGAASESAAILAPFVLLVHLLTLCLAAGLLLEIHLAIPHLKTIVGAAIASSCVWSYVRYECTKRGTELIDSLSSVNPVRRSEIIGGVIFFETLLFPVVLAFFFI